MRLLLPGPLKTGQSDRSVIRTVNNSKILVLTVVVRLLVIGSIGF